ncbi:type II secretion system F family protein [Vibrio furnissii]|uniref:type II secretion system F family protein n=1 Tax=Vibrio furnissii TaxID=29494 RepID=UPI0024BA083A|nr:type II secretion system F family protein [Vibrio furnissii]WHR51157.1 type II secretion system F family protein [Vibrio furnissii]
METILAFIDGFNLNEEFLILISVLFFTVMIVVTIFILVIGSRSRLKKRLDLIESAAISGYERKSKFNSKFESLTPILTPKNEKEVKSVRTKLIRAGFHDEKALTNFYALKILSTLLGFMGSVAYYLFVGSSSYIIFVFVYAIGFGLFLPNFILERLVKKRQSRIKSGVADALDLLVVCTESGLGLNMSLMRIAQELAISHPDMAEELDTVCLKIKAGYDMSTAFKELVERTGVTELSGLVSMLSHASRIGGSLSQTLRDYTEDYRDKRSQEVEEIAAKIPTKMVFPMLVCIWPSFFIVVIGPAAINLMKVFS